MSVVRGNIGELTQKFELKCNIEWTIADILSLAEQDSFESPSVSVPGSEWYLKIYPNGHTHTAGWVSLYLHMEKNQTSLKRAHFRMGVKKSNGAVEHVGGYLSRLFDGDTGYGCRRFLKRSVLQQRAAEFTSATGSLTVTCILEVDGSYDFTSRLVKLSEDFEALLTSKKFCDGVLKVKKEKFAVHKSVVASRCPAFSAIFEADKKTGAVDIVGCEPAAFRDFLMYLYSGTFQNLSNNPSEVYKIADKYGVNDLKADCVLFMANNLTVENVFDAAVFGDHFDEKELKSEIQNFFIINFAEIVSASKWDSFMDHNRPLANNLLKTLGNKMGSKKMKLVSMG